MNRSALSRYFQLGFLVCLALTPFAIDYDYFRPTKSQFVFLNLATLLIVTGGLLAALARPPQWKIRHRLLMAAPILVLMVIKLLRFFLAGQGWLSRSPNFFALMIWLLVILFLPRPRWSFYRKSVWLLWALSVVITLYGLLQYFGIEILHYAEGRKEKQIIISFLGHPNYIASFCAPLAFLFLAEFILARGWVARGLMGVAIVFSGLVVVFGAARAGMLSLIVGAIFFAVLLHRTRAIRITGRQFALSSLALVVVLAGSFVFIRFVRKSPFEISSRLYANYEVASRLYYWKLGMKQFGEHWLLGSGPGYFRDNYWSLVEQDQEKATPAEVYLLYRMEGVPAGEMHNEFLELLVESGLVGFFLAAFFLALVLLRATRKLRCRALSKSRCVRLVGLLTMFLAFMVDAQFGFPFQLPASGLLFLLNLWLLI
ncbi:MAG: O-antigen ligase family protein [bacterium]